MEYKDIEEEMCAITKIKKDKYPQRQDFLAALLRAIEKIPEAEYDRMSENAYQWQKEATRHFNHRKPLPDFPDRVRDEVDGMPLQTSVEELRGDDAAPAISGDEQPATVRRKRRQLPPRRVPDYANLSGEKDRYGITAGTNTHEAVKMYEKGCTAGDVEQALGGRYRNILSKLADAGHRVERLGVGFYKVTHKDDIK
jgi:hypothetical protein